MLIRSRSIIRVLCLLVLLAPSAGACRVILSIRRLLLPLLHLSLPFLPFLRVHLGFFSQDIVDLKRIGEEDDGGVIEEVGSRRVVVSLELDHVLVARVPAHVRLERLLSDCSATALLFILYH